MYSLNVETFPILLCDELFSNYILLPVPLLGARRGGDQQSDQFTISSSSSATTARGQEVNYDPTIVSLINASSSNNVSSTVTKLFVVTLVNFYFPQIQSQSGI